VLLLVLLGGLGAPAAGLPLQRLTIGNGLAQMLFVLLVFIYYASYDIPLGFRAGLVLPVAGLIVGGLALLAHHLQSRSGGQPSPRAAEGVDARFPQVVALGLLLLPLSTLLWWNVPAPTLQPPAQLRVMSFNLHQGFNTAGQLNMEAIAQVIEASGADVVGLQEVSRGWLTTGSLDMLAWLSHRLEMPFVSGPTADLQWGNAVLSRYPLRNAETHALPPHNLLLLRGFIQVELEMAGPTSAPQTVTLFATHLHHRGGDSPIRQAQVQALLNAWAGTSPAVILGDLNALPGTPEITALREAGLVDTSTLLAGPLLRATFPAAQPSGQIDYIWTTPNLSASDFRVLPTTVSDHLPIVVTLKGDF